MINVNYKQYHLAKMTVATHASYPTRGRVSRWRLVGHSTIWRSKSWTLRDAPGHRYEIRPQG